MMRALLITLALMPLGTKAQNSGKPAGAPTTATTSPAPTVTPKPTTSSLVADDSADDPPKRNLRGNAVAKAAAEQTSGATTAREVAARNAAAEMIKSKLATQTTRPVFEHGRRRLQCVNDDSTTDGYGDTCSSWYDSNWEHPRWPCGCCDDEDFISSLQCCACGGGEGTFAPTVTPKPTADPTPRPTFAPTTAAPSPTPTTAAPTVTFAPTASPLIAVDGGGENGIRTAAALWFSDRAAAIRTYGHISTWETSGVTDMSSLFFEASSFNEDIGAWDISGVNTTRGMFAGAYAFNQDIGNWAVDNVMNMEGMFASAYAFNQDLSGWAVHSVTSMGGIFSAAYAFDQDLGWCVDGDVRLYYAFDGTACWSTSCGVTQGSCP